MTARGKLPAILQDSRCVLTDGDNRVLAHEIWDRASRERAKIGRSLVLACVDNTLDGIGIYLNLVFGEAVPVFFPRDARPELLARFIADFQPNYLIAPLECEALPDGFTQQFSWGAFGVYAAECQRQHAFHEDLCLLATTSGSTGSPKVVRQSFANVVENSRQIVTALGLTSKSKAITALPISYTYGMSVVNCQVLCGGDIVVSNLAPTQKGFLELMLNEGVTLLAGVPQTYAQLNAMRFFKSRYAAGVQTFLQAGGKLAAALEADLVKKIAQSGQDFFMMYGQAEATTRMSILPARDFGSVTGSAGLALAGGRFTVVDDNGMALGTGQEGELWYHGLNVSLGYARSSADLNAPDGFNGVLKTGDVGYVDDQGYVFITGRLKRFAKVSGHSVNLTHLEEILQTALQTEVCCLEKDDMICVCHTGDIDVSRFEGTVRGETNLMLRDFRLHTVPCFPKTTSGKIQYSQLAEILSDATETPKRVAG